MATQAKKTTVETVSLDKEYRLTNDQGPITYQIRSGRDGQLIISKIGDKFIPNTAIRYCPNETSIYLKDQSDFAVVADVTFEHGRIVAHRGNKTLQDFLEAHPSNVANGGNLFELINYEQEAKNDLVYEELVQDVKHAIREKLKETRGHDALEMVASVLKGSLEEARQMSEAELKRFLYDEAEIDPYYFVNDDGDVNVFDDEIVQRKYITLSALRDGIIKTSATGKAIMWGHNNGQKIFTAAPGVELIDAFIEYLETDDGMLVLEAILKKK